MVPGYDPKVSFYFFFFFPAAVGQSTSSPGQMPAKAWDVCGSAWKWTAAAS